MTNLAIAAQGLRESYGDKVVLDTPDLDDVFLALTGRHGEASR
ncbi:hypothetical protein ABGB12_12620 [Actinocorallia sp. B10E7]